MTPHRRGPWSQSEDRCLLQLVQAQGAQCWVRISHLLGTRSPKQCRERYHQNLKPTLNHEPITPEEGVLIERLVGEMGKKWAEIARRLQGRSDNAVKNWWNGGVNRRTRMSNQRGAACHRESASKVPVRQLPLPPPGPITISPMGRNFEAPLPSPSMASEISRADSAEGAPSLVSDSASTFSTSPRLPVSPSVNGENILPPLSSNRSEGRRPSLPLLHVGTNTFASERDVQTPGFLSSFDTDRKVANGHFSSSAFGRTESQYEPPQEYHYLRHKIPSPVPTEHRLPPIRLLCAATQQTDGRMNLSNILG